MSTVSDEERTKRRQRQLRISDRVLFSYWKYNLCCKFPELAERLKTLDCSRDGLLAGVAILFGTPQRVTMMSPLHIPHGILDLHWQHHPVGTIVTVSGGHFDDM